MTAPEKRLRILVTGASGVFGREITERLTRRRGDTRPLRVGWTWLEFFADRARAGGFVTG